MRRGDSVCMSLALPQPWEREKNVPGRPGFILIGTSTPFQEEEVDDQGRVDDRSPCREYRMLPARVVELATTN